MNQYPKDTSDSGTYIHIFILIVFLENFLQYFRIRCNDHDNCLDLMKTAITHFVATENDRLISIVFDKIVGIVFAIKPDLCNILLDMKGKLSINTLLRFLFLDTLCFT